MGGRKIDLKAVTELKLADATGQLRALPVRFGAGEPPKILAVHSAVFDVDPYREMFFFPSDTLHLTLFDSSGEILWTRDLGPGVVPGLWFCPVFAFDLDRDGAEEIWLVDNVNEQHPLGLSGYRLERLDPRTGKTTGQWPWPSNPMQPLSHVFRNFIVGGYVRAEPVLVTAQGTYEDMHFQAWLPDMRPRWEKSIAGDAPGARGSHMCPVTDLDGDGTEELMWGERCIELDAGVELFCADRHEWRGHSDVIEPVFDAAAGRWCIYTCRESDGGAAPRVNLYDEHGERVWGAVDEGHIDMGWVARIGEGGRKVASAIRIGEKTCGPDGRFHSEMTEFAFDAMTGEPVELGWSTYRTVPVDLDGDGVHEFVRGRASGDGEVIDCMGERICEIGGAVAMASKFLDAPGEQLLSYHADGTVRIWADANAEDSADAKARYGHPYYQANQALTATGYNLVVLGGL